MMVVGQAILFLLLSLAIVNCNQSHDVVKLLDEYWNWRLGDMPEFATYVGFHKYDDRLDDLSLKAFETRYYVCEFFNRRAMAMEAIHTDHEDLVNLRALRYELKTYMDGYVFKGFLQPLNYLEGVHIDVERLIALMDLETLKDYQNLISRLQALPQQISQVEELMREGVKQGIVNHEISMKGVAESLSRHVVSTAESSPLWKPFADVTVESATEEEIETIQMTAKSIIVEKVSPAFKRLRDYVANEYTTRPKVAISSLPNGKDRYDALIKFHACNDTAEPLDIHRMGFEYAEMYGEEMLEAIDEYGFKNMTCPDFAEMVRTDPKYFYDDAEDLLREYRRISDEIDSTLTDLFRNETRKGLEILPDPNPNDPATFYQPGSVYGSRNGSFYVNTCNLEGQPKYSMVALAMHEGNPGRHLQSSHAIGNTDLPFFRRTIEGRRYYASPSRFPTNTAYEGGWALYAQTLGYNTSVYDDPIVRYGHLSKQMLYSLGLALDSGIHALGWSREDAIFYMLEQTAEPLVNIEKIADMIITWPGHILGYKMGEIKIQELKEKAAAALGGSYDVTEFHETVLDAVGPLDLLEDEVETWIDSKINVKLE